MNKYLLFTTCSIIAVTGSQFAVASPFDNTTHTYTLELKPISNSDNAFNLAASVFLPDKGDDYGFNGRDLGSNYTPPPVIDNCPGYSLAACPANASCNKCGAGNKFSLTGCNDGYKISGSSCIAKTCSEINSAFQTDVPVNQVCSIISAFGKTCYQSCRNIDFSGYPLTDCATNATCANHPDCATGVTQKGNCSPIKKKVSSCNLSYQKVNSAGTACIDKDDTCASGYFKSCDSGTTGSPRYTERGTACYQCAPVKSTSADILYSDMTTSNKILTNKTPIGIVFDTNNRLAIALDFENNYWSTVESNFGVAPYTDTEPGSYIAQGDTKGKENTAKIVANGGAKAIAASYCYNYSTQGTSAKDWFLPSGAQIKKIQSIESEINETLYNLGKNRLPIVFWSSTSCHSQGAFHTWYDKSHGCGQTGNGGKIDIQRGIIPVINY